MARKSTPSPIPKDERRQFQDLLDYLELLDDAVRFVEEGRFAYYKTMLWVLRALVGRGEQQGGILRRFVAKHGVTDVRILFKGLEGIPPTNPLSRDRIKTLDEYLSEEVILESVPYTYPEYIWNLASQDAVHPDDEMDAHCACGEMVFRHDRQRQVLSMGRTLASFSKELVKVATTPRVTRKVHRSCCRAVRDGAGGGRDGGVATGGVGGVVAASGRDVARRATGAAPQRHPWPGVSGSRDPVTFARGWRP